MSKTRLKGRKRDYSPLVLSFSSADNKHYHVAISQSTYFAIIAMMSPVKVIESRNTDGGNDDNDSTFRLLGCYQSSKGININKTRVKDNTFRQIMILQELTWLYCTRFETYEKCRRHSNMKYEIIMLVIWYVFVWHSIGNIALEHVRLSVCTGN